MIVVWSKHAIQRSQERRVDLVDAPMVLIGLIGKQMQVNEPFNVEDDRTIFACERTGAYTVTILTVWKTRVTSEQRKHKRFRVRKRKVASRRTGSVSMQVERMSRRERYTGFDYKQAPGE